MLVVLTEEAQSNGRNRVVAPRFIQTAEQRTAFLKHKKFIQTAEQRTALLKHKKFIQTAEQRTSLL